MGVRKRLQGCVTTKSVRTECRRSFSRVARTTLVAASLLGAYASSTAATLAAEPPKHVPRRAAEPTSGTLFLCGGGLLGDDLYKRFLDLCGGEDGHLAIITTASDYAESDPQLILDKWRARTGCKITLLHTHSTETANRDDFVAPLRSATGVWIVGGKQYRLTDAYLGTKLLRELQAFQARGGVIGGSSAGAAVMSDVMLCGGSLEEPGIYEGFSLLRDGIVDQHFSERGREPRLLVALRRHPGRPGFGIDERTALIVRGRDLQVAGEGSVTIYLPESSQRPVHRIQLKNGDREDLQALRRAAVARSAEVDSTRLAALPRVPKGSLLIVGGGRTPDVVKKRFIELAGGPEAKIAVVATGSDTPRPEELEAAWLKAAGAKNVVVLGPRSAAEANDPKFVETLKDAKGVWFGGGRQWRFVDAFEATACYDAFCRVLDRGGVIGGSSAGATIQGEYLVRGSPLTNRVMMAEGYERGFGFLPGAAIDQHFTQRKRQPDMELLKRSYPKLLGLGIDEATAVVVQGAQMEVIGDNTVSVYPPSAEPVVGATPAAASASTEPTATPAATTSAVAESNVVPATAEAPLFAPQILKSGDAYDLERFTIQDGGRQ